MSRVPAGADPSLLYVAARRVLLDGLDALAAQRGAVVLVGAQAVYLRSAGADFGEVAVFTSDADLGLDPALLGPEPHLDDAMSAAGFLPRVDAPGTWLRAEHVGDNMIDIGIDLLVAETFAGGGRRAARIPPHAHHSARQTPGLEATTVDNDPMTITSLEPDGDHRATQVKVAGIAALLVAKAYKIHDRLQDPRPGQDADKDAGDVLRLMAASDPDTVIARFNRLLEDAHVSHVVEEGLRRLRVQFEASATPGTDMAVRAIGGVAMPEATIRAIAPAFVAALPRS